MTRDDVVRVARSWLGTPFRKKGRSASGLDCMGLLVVVAQAFDVPHTDYPDYFDWPDPNHRSIREFDAQLIRLPPVGNLIGTVGLFAEVRLPGHAGFFSELHGLTHIIHARTGHGVVEQEYRPAERELRMIARWAFPALEL